LNVLNGSPLNLAALNAPVVPLSALPPPRWRGIAAGAAYRGLVALVFVEGFAVEMLATTELTLKIVAGIVAAAGAPGPLAAAFVGLFTSAGAIGPGTVLGDLTEPGFPGYDRQPIAPTDWQAASILPDGSVQSVCGACAQFRMTGDTP